MRTWLDMIAPTTLGRIHIVTEDGDKTLCGRSKIYHWEVGEGVEVPGKHKDIGQMCSRCTTKAEQISMQTLSDASRITT